MNLLSFIPEGDDPSTTISSLDTNEDPIEEELTSNEETSSTSTTSEGAAVKNSMKKSHRIWYGLTSTGEISPRKAYALRLGSSPVRRGTRHIPYYYGKGDGIVEYQSLRRHYGQW